MNEARRYHQIVPQTPDQASFLIDRRDLLRLAAASLLSPAAFSQGVSTRNVKPQPRGKPSGLPFNARFTDIAREAGLTQPVIYGGVESKKHIIETTGCGCAFVDYDNDGWVDIFVLNGMRLDGKVENATNRLYKNNRNGTFTDVTEKSGLARAGWASAVCIGDYNNDGYDDLFITYFGQNVLYRNNGNGTFTEVTESAGLLTKREVGIRLHVRRLQPRRTSRSVRGELPRVRSATAPAAGSNRNCAWKGIPVMCGPRGFPTRPPSLYRNNGNGTFTDVSAEVRHIEDAEATG